MQKIFSSIYKISALGLAFSLGAIFVLPWLINKEISLLVAAISGVLNIVSMLVIKKIARVDEIAFLEKEMNTPLGHEHFESSDVANHHADEH
ncbi:hypothetical protein HZU75_06480 [Chitinibacter fontanus]|uniref:Uncharacterized protein n=1 Tax=Chitinibacter fontanus TaxID=1737446 RepID=A0A7D5ZDM9_9NEIS|nr:hypothetical protein [Chitinibacter fontanus]QLI81204.1 hypothetical protein HZU75_06480 [Chitinibacter fontanus]